ncbi:MAG TPA: CHRD domain-containing protein, partial [Chitinophagaceae bacterium]|nr:CHRD domain-containing protein [Chitinophagaceae bacterium]
MKIKFPLLLLMSFISLLSYSQIIYFKGSFTGSGEVPANSSSGRGTVIVKYDMATNTLQLFGDYQNLTDTAIASHIHEAAPGVSGPVIIPLNNTGDTTGVLSGGGTLTDVQ